MRIAFIIACLAAIGVAVVQIRSEEKVLRNKMLTLQMYYEHEVPQEIGRQRKELAYLTAPTAVQTRAVAMGLPMVDKKDAKTGLAKNTVEGRDSARRPRVTPPPSIDGRPDFGHD